MLFVDYTLDGKTVSMRFPENRKGNSDSVKYIKQLYDDRKNHPWFYLQDKIKKFEDIFNSYRTSPGKKNEAKAELLRLREERSDLLYMLGITEPPSLIKLSIYRK